MISDLVLKNRSYRRFNEKTPMKLDTLRELTDLARISPSSRNQQPLKFILSSDPQTNSIIFPTLAWAGYFKDWAGPAEGERPSAYIVVLGDRDLTGDFDTDLGIAAQTILLGAVEKGLGGCMIASVKREALRQNLDIPKNYDVLLVIALGEPAEQVVLEELGEDGDIKYWRDEQGVHHVPKRSLDQLVFRAY